MSWFGVMVVIEQARVRTVVCDVTTGLLMISAVSGISARAASSSELARTDRWKQLDPIVSMVITWAKKACSVSAV